MNDPFFLQSKIDHFWDWFQQHEEKFRKITDPEAAREMLDNQILSFGMFAWEIGHGTDKSLYLLISPNGDKERFKISKQLVDAAPEFPHWEFYSARFPEGEDWDFVFEMFDANFVSREIDAFEWEYAIRPQWENTYDIIVDPIDLEGDFTPELKLHAANLVVTSLLGEEIKITHVHEVSVFSELAGDHHDEWFDIEELYEHLEELIDS